jgi:hypothetical protein
MHINMAQVLSNRSTHLAHDKVNSDLLNGVVLTNSLLKTLSSVRTSALEEVNDNAFAIVGPYGSGKSTTALFIYQYLCGQIPDGIQKKLDHLKIDALPLKNKYNKTFILVGDNTSLNESIREAFGLAQDVAPVLWLEKELRKGSRIAIFIDEMGKYLEYAAEFPNEGDVYVLQQIAELAHRSAGKLLLVTIRHQGLIAYVSKLPTTYLNEWKKIQGRFSDLIHVNSVDESIKIIYDRLDALGIKSTKTPPTHLELLRGNTQISENIIEDVLSRSYQISPLLLLLIVSFFKKHAQNERSIFSFFNSESEYSMNSHLKHKGKTPYSLLDFYHFIEKNLEHAILESEDSELWSKIRATKLLAESKIMLTKDISTEALHGTIVAIGLLGLYGDDVGLHAQKNIILALTTLLKKAGTPNEAIVYIDILEKKNLITFRGHNDAYNLWHGSTIDIPAKINERLQEEYTDFNIANELNRFFPHDQLVARRSFVETGSFRVLDWKYLSPGEESVSQSSDNDGLVVCHVGLDVDVQQFLDSYLPGESNGVLYLAMGLSPQDVNLLAEYFSCSNLLVNDKEINTDKNARDELTTRISYLEDLITSFLNWHSPQVFKNVHYQYFTGSNWQNLSPSATVNKLISGVIDKKFPHAPRIHNELINTHNPSGSAMSGLKNLINHLFEFHDHEDLNISSRGPEYAIYLNTLKHTGIHANRPGGWSLSEPENIASNLNVVWAYLESEITMWKGEGKAVSLLQLEKLLGAEPHGVKNGLAKVLIFAKFIEHRKELSLYEDGTFTPDIYKDTLERMMKLPKKFTLVYVPQNDSHTGFLKSVGAIFNPQIGESTLLLVVSAIIRYVSRLPYYTKHTSTLSKRAKRFIKTVLQASSPEALIFSSIPEALGISTESTGYDLVTQPDDLLKKLLVVREEIENNYPKLHQKCIQQFSKTWGFKANSIDILRKELLLRVSTDISELIVEESLTAFYNRVQDHAVDNEAWFISVVSFLANRPLEKWHDDHLILFGNELRRKHFQVEEIYRLKQSSLVGLSQDKDLTYVAHMITETLKNASLDETQLEPLIELLRKYYPDAEKAYYEQD